MLVVGRDPVNTINGSSAAWNRAQLYINPGTEDQIIITLICDDSGALKLGIEADSHHRIARGDVLFRRREKPSHPLIDSKHTID